eukprot:scaffold360211_cov63-Attheya_sp.AAC.1
MKQTGNGCWKATPTKQNPLSFGRLAFAWDVAANFPKKAYQAVYQLDHYKVLTSNNVACKKRNREEERGEEEVEGRKKALGLSVIEDRDYARSIFIPQYFYEKKYVARKTQEAQTAGIRASRQDVGTFRKESQQKWKYLSDKDREPYNLLAPISDADQPSIKDRIIEALKQNVTTTWWKVATDINDWCSEYTLQMWMESQLDYRTYSQRVLPLLSKAQKMAAHVTFSKWLQSHWGLPPRKYLWIHYDEKCFYGFVPRNNAKMCEALRLHREF